MKLWSMREGVIVPTQFDLDLSRVYEAAYHRWWLFANPPHQLATLSRVGGVS